MLTFCHFLQFVPVRDHHVKQKPYSVWSHAIGQQKEGGGEAGGTLAVALESFGKFAVSGGGDASCCFHILDDCGEINARTVDSSFRISAHSAGVSAVLVTNGGQFVVSGGKDGVSHDLHENNNNGSNKDISIDLTVTYS